jgi:hypothetical protein
MAKLINLVPTASMYLKKENTEEQTQESLEDMDISLPSKLDMFLDRTIKIVKNYNLPRKKEQLVIAKLIDALNMNPSELSQAVQKMKKYKIVKR